jgi:TonB family protein
MTWWHYLLLVNIYLTLFFGFYALLLRRETFFQLNRIYLVSAALLSFIIPLIQAQWVKNLFITQQVKNTLYSTNSADMIVRFAPIKDNPLTIGQLLVVLYIIGAAFLTIRLLWHLVLLKRLINKPAATAFSFFKKIKLSHSIPGREVIIRHEEVHARQWHSADVLIIEAVMIINWFNPVVYLYRSAIKHIHEYIADEQALLNGTNKADYALLLLSQTFNAPAHHLVNPFFNHSLLKQRIMMLQKSKSQRIKLAKYGLSAPLFILMLILSSATINSSKAVNAINKHAEVVFLKPAESVMPNEDVTTNGSEPLKEVKVNAIDEPAIVNGDTIPAKGDELFTEVEQPPAFPGGIKAFGEFLGRNTRYPKEAREKNIQGKVIVSFVVEKDGSLTGLKVMRPISADLDEEALRVLKLSPRWNPGIQNGHKVRVHYSVPIQFALAPDNVASTNVNAKSDSGPVYSSVEQAPGFPGGEKAFGQYLANNVKYPAKARENKTQGRVIVTFVVEADGSLTNARVIRGIGDGADEEALRVINASPKWTPGMQDGKKVKVQYTVPISFSLANTEQNKTGRVEPEKVTDIYYSNNKTPDTAYRKVTERTLLLSNPNAPKPLYLVNGKEVSTLERINPKDIQSISVIKDKNAILKYGAKGVNGVVLVELKSSKIK